MPPPDRWVVIRTLLPDGERTAYATGCDDAASGVVAPLATCMPSIDATGGSPLTPPGCRQSGHPCLVGDPSEQSGALRPRPSPGDLPGLTGAGTAGFHWTRHPHGGRVGGPDRRGPAGWHAQPPGSSRLASQLRWALPEDGEDEIPTTSTRGRNDATLRQA